MMSDVEKLVNREPWRRGLGQPTNALDPTWNAERSVKCGGNIRHERGSSWWWCEKCGCCGNHDFAKAHRPINDPFVYLLQSVRDYVAQRKKEGVSEELAMQQMAHIAGVSIRYAAAVPPEQLADYIQKVTAA